MIEAIRNKLSCALLGHEWILGVHVERYVCARCDKKPSDYAEILRAKHVATSRRELTQDNGDCG